MQPSFHIQLSRGSYGVRDTFKHTKRRGTGGRIPYGIMSENDTNRNYGRLLSDLTRGVLVIVGSGISIAATENGIASWCGLLKDGVEECRSRNVNQGADFNTTLNSLIDSGDMDQLPAAASIIRGKLSKSAGGYSRWLQNTVGSLQPKNPDIIQAILDRSLPLATTNYDKLLSALLSTDQ
ncbi:hypothetical protein BU23DRAFT_570103 [Bimuria novae-zelandiae CBS 107.79]|uniref:SIR2-like domain-containing protein n=1 Tax=Bimuria novae-zelandiae CBS 107.79 TaxID=1447943 RepID=A0A6A5V5M5_9PLEO|nr:hypothetical protein BU23DRAFT_570103 [Bimuria novae-zelandiae CBS 107.79]